MHFRSSDNRDRVYAPLGLAEDIDLSTYKVDYNMKSADTFMYMTRYLIDRHQNLNVLGYGAYPSWISWCPHWNWGYVPTDPFHRLHFAGADAEVDATHYTPDGRRAYTFRPLMSAYDRMQYGFEGKVGVAEDAKPEPAYRASNGAESSFIFEGGEYHYGSDSSPRLRLKGFIVDTVQGEPMPATPPQILIVVNEQTVWEEAVLASGDTYITGESMLSAFRRTIRADTLTQNDGIQRRGATVIWDASEIDFNARDERSSNDMLIENYINHAHKDCRFITRGRSLFRT
jgi:hypothetical protein